VKNCKHEISRGIDCRLGEFFSYCIICGAKWNDNGKKWEKQNKERLKHERNRSIEENQ